MLEILTIWTANARYYTCITNHKMGLDSIVIEVSLEIYKHIRENSNRIFISYQNCKVYDRINFRSCYKCGRFGHSAARCRNDTVCLRCSGKHETHGCMSGVVKCSNSICINDKYNARFNINHMVTCLCVRFWKTRLRN